MGEQTSLFKLEIVDFMLSYIAKMMFQEDDLLKLHNIIKKSNTQTTRY